MGEPCGYCSGDSGRPEPTVFSEPSGMTALASVERLVHWKARALGWIPEHKWPDLRLAGNGPRHSLSLGDQAKYPGLGGLVR